MQLSEEVKPFYDNFDRFLQCVQNFEKKISLKPEVFATWQTPRDVVTSEH